MTPHLIHDRGRGPEIAGTRITVYNLLQSFLDPTVTEEEICQIYELTPKQVAAARAYVLSNPDTVLAEHLRIEEKLAAQNPPDVRQQAERARAVFKSFKQWLAERESADHSPAESDQRLQQVPTFREWLAEKASG